MSKWQFPEDNPEHPDHDAAVARAWAGHDKRVHDQLRKSVDDLCEGILPCIADKIKHSVRQAYYIGCADGLQFAKESEEERVYIPEGSSVRKVLDK
jgi:hypothetical protein